MKILHILDHSIPLHSGYTFRTLAILQKQRAFGWETEHITSPKHNLESHPKDEEEVIDGLHYYRTQLAAGVFNQSALLNQWAIVTALKKRLIEILPEVKPDIIHAHSPILNGLAAIKVARRYQIPVVYEIRAFWEDAAVGHGTTIENSLRYKITRTLETHIIKKADVVTTICEGLKKDILERGISLDKVIVIPNAVDIVKFDSRKKPDQVLIEKLGIDGKCIIGFIGSFYAYEGLPLLLKAIPTIISKHPNTHFLLVGGGPQEEEINRLINELKLKDNVLFIGCVPHDQIQDYYDLIDIFVYPRLSIRLTDLVTPLKPLEAMAKRRLVVASNVGGHKELIRNGESGILFRAGDIDALAEAVLYLLDNRDCWTALQNAARRFVEEERTWEVCVARYKSVYSQLIKGKLV
jgi:PEP-CTERM/exosortase A-associated glycosyltransferase